jgi:RNA polymerase-binding transcription factor DksA
MHSQEFIEKMKQRLEEEKERLSEELSQVPAHTEMQSNDDEWEDASPLEMQVDEVSKDIIAQLKSDISKIETASERIEKGEYGVCSVGGEDISEERLEVIPWADTCVEHANA